MWQAFVNLIADALLLINQFLAGMGVPYSFGFAIILFTFAIKLVTLPLTLKQLQSSKAMQELQPEIQKLQKKYKDDKEKLSKAQMELYKERGVNPLSGCLPTLIQMPVWFALYQALFNLADLGTLREGFLWIPSLAEPRDLSWLWPLPSTGEGWLTAGALLVLPILTVLTQLVVQKMTTPPSSDSQQAMMGQMMTLMPIMFGFFALQVPQGLVLYWVTSNLFMMVQQYFITRPTPTQPTFSASGEKPAVYPPPEEEIAPPDRSKRKRDGRQKSKR
jgi:YidC/Oxa1 family membrane protein insertase